MKLLSVERVNYSTNIINMISFSWVAQTLVVHVQLPSRLSQRGHFFSSNFECGLFPILLKLLHLSATNIIVLIMYNS